MIVNKGSRMIPTRSVIWLMLFTATFVLYMIRINLSIIILGMVGPRNSSNATTLTVPECVSQKNDNEKTLGNLTEFVGEHGHIAVRPGVTYDWDAKLQGLILGAYFWGYVVGAIPSAAVAEKFGPRKCVAVSFLLCAILTLLGPVSASVHPNLLIASRFLIGLLGGTVYPAVHCLISKWAPPAEKGKFISAGLGGSLGTVITWPLLGKIMESARWEWAFYTTGIVLFVWTFLWIFFVYDDPNSHPWISAEEKEYINASLAGTVSNKKRIAPYKSIALSIPSWALIVSHFGNLWGLFFLMTAGPNFMSTVLGFDIGHTGFLAALPYLARLITGFIFGNIGDIILARNLMSKTAIRKSFTILSHIVPGLFLVIQTFVGCHISWTIALLTLSLASNGASTISNLSNAQDLAPNFAGSLYGIANCIGSTTGFISPMIVGYLTSEHNGLYEWHTIFYIGSTVYIACGIVFMLFGSGDIQPYNYTDEERDIETSEKRAKGIDNVAFDQGGENKTKL